ncbi:MAG TPA: HD domain-containing protein [Firmicutes bacterium]|nr:HD domain-containing protein [Bacillota bacterium]
MGAELAAADTNEPLECSDELFSGIISALSMVLDVEEDKKLYHGWRVAAVATLAAENLGTELLPEVFYGGLLHDIGAMGFPDHMVHYPTLEAQLSVPEILQHPARGAAIIQEIPGLEGATGMILEHHEYWNGRGYPAGKREAEISQESQVLRAADSLDLVFRAYTGIHISGAPIGPASNSPGASSISTLKNHIAATFELGAGSEFSRPVYELIIESAGIGSSRAPDSSSDSVFQHLLSEDGLKELISDIRGRIPAIIPRCRQNPGRLVLSIFAKVIDAKHQYTAGHSERVAEYAVRIGKAMGLKPSELREIEAAGLLHDTGKVSVPRSVLDKSGKLTADELRIIRGHPRLTLDIIGSIRGFGEVARIAGYHHERYDGKGYPDGLKGADIPLGARILAVADTLDAVTSGRPYQRVMSCQEALELLRRNAGTQFDPQVVEAAGAAFELNRADAGAGASAGTMC